MNVHVYHVGSPNPAVIENADFRTYDEGGSQHLIVHRGGEILAIFAETKWSAAVKYNA